MRLLHSDAALHRELAPTAPIQRLIFDLLEQLRVETLVTDSHPGIRSNLLRRFRDWSLRFHDDGHADSELGLLIYTIAQVAWSRLSGQPTLAETDDLIEVTRGRITEVIGNQLVGLRRERNHQREYAEHALSIARIIDESLLAEHAEETGSKRIDNEKALSRITLALDFSDESEDSNIATIVTGNSKVLAEQKQVYRVFNREFDRELRAASQVRVACGWLSCDSSANNSMRAYSTRESTCRAWRDKYRCCWRRRGATAGCSAKRKGCLTVVGCRNWSPHPASADCFARINTASKTIACCPFSSTVRAP